MFSPSNLQNGRRAKACRPKAFTLIELLVVISIIALLIGILLPALGNARKTARQMQNGTQLRGIHQGMVTFAQSNKFWYPGLTSTGRVNGEAVDSRLEASVDHLAHETGFLTDEYTISPGEIDPNLGHGGSYAVLDFADTTTIGDEASTLGQLEWRDALNSTAIVISDRQVGMVGTPRSIWATNNDQWIGSVAYNDNHVAFELTSEGHEGQYGTNTGTLGTAVISDLFDDTVGDGAMIHDPD